MYTPYQYQPPPAYCNPPRSANSSPSTPQAYQYTSYGGYPAPHKSAAANPERSHPRRASQKTYTSQSTSYYNYASPTCTNPDRSAKRASSTSYTSPFTSRYDYTPTYTSNAPIFTFPERSTKRATSKSHTSHSTPHTDFTPTHSYAKPKRSTKRATLESGAYNPKDRAEIHAGFSFKNWDPTEEPILLLGSVFDANSLGKWIYDWTVSTYGPQGPVSEYAGELWLLLTTLGYQEKKPKESVSRPTRQIVTPRLGQDSADDWSLWRFDDLPLGVERSDHPLVYRHTVKASNGRHSSRQPRDSAGEFYGSMDQLGRFLHNNVRTSYLRVLSWSGLIKLASTSPINPQNASNSENSEWPSGLLKALRRIS